MPPASIRDLISQDNNLEVQIDQLSSLMDNLSSVGFLNIPLGFLGDLEKTQGIFEGINKFTKSITEKIPKLADQTKKLLGFEKERLDVGKQTIKVNQFQDKLLDSTNKKTEKLIETTEKYNKLQEVQVKNVLPSARQEAKTFFPEQKIPPLVEQGQIEPPKVPPGAGAEITPPTPPPPPAPNVPPPIATEIVPPDLDLGDLDRGVPKVSQNFDEAAKSVKFFGIEVEALKKRIETFSKVTDRLSIALLGVKGIVILRNTFSDLRREINNTQIGLELLQKQGFSTDFIRSLSLAQAGILGNVSALKELATTSVSTFNEFNTVLRRVGTVFQTGEQDLEKRNANIAAFGQTLQKIVNVELDNTVTSAQAANAAYQALSAGFTTADESSAVLTAGLKLTASAGSNAEATMQLLAKTLNAYNLSAGSASETAAKLNAIVENGITTVDELNVGFGQLASVAAQSGVSLDDLGAALAVLTQQGTSTAVAMTRLQSLFIDLISPQTQERIEKLNLGVQFNSATVEAEGLVSVLTKLNDALGGSSERLSKIFPNISSFNAATNLLNENLTKFQSISEAIATTTVENLERVFRIRIDEDQILQFQQLINRVQETLISLGRTLAPIFGEIFENIQTVIGGLANFVEENQELIKLAVKAALAFTAFDGVVKTLLGTVGKLIGLFITWRFFTNAIFKDLGALFTPVKNLEEGAGIFERITNAVTKNSLVLDQNLSIWQKLQIALRNITGIAPVTAQAITQPADAVDEAGKKIEGATEQINSFSAGFKDIGTVAQETQQKFADKAENFRQQVQKTFKLDPTKNISNSFKKLDDAIEEAGANILASLTNISGKSVSIFSRMGASISKFTQLFQSRMRFIGDILRQQGLRPFLIFEDIMTNRVLKSIKQFAAQMVANLKVAFAKVKDFFSGENLRAIIIFSKIMANRAKRAVIEFAVSLKTQAVAAFASFQASIVSATKSLLAFLNVLIGNIASGFNTAIKGAIKLSNLMAGGFVAAWKAAGSAIELVNKSMQKFLGLTVTGLILAALATYMIRIINMGKAHDKLNKTLKESNDKYQEYLQSQKDVNSLVGVFSEEIDVAAEKTKEFEVTLFGTSQAGQFLNNTLAKSNKAFADYKAGFEDMNIAMKVGKGIIDLVNGVLGIFIGLAKAALEGWGFLLGGMQRFNMNMETSERLTGEVAQNVGVIQTQVSLLEKGFKGSFEAVVNGEKQIIKVQDAIAGNVAGITEFSKEHLALVQEAFTAEQNTLKQKVKGLEKEEETLKQAVDAAKFEKERFKVGSRQFQLANEALKQAEGQLKITQETKKAAEAQLEVSKDQQKEIANILVTYGQYEQSADPLKSKFIQTMTASSEKLTELSNKFNQFREDMSKLSEEELKGIKNLSQTLNDTTLKLGKNIFTAVNLGFLAADEGLQKFNKEIIEAETYKFVQDPQEAKALIQIGLKLVQEAANQTIEINKNTAERLKILAENTFTTQSKFQKEILELNLENLETQEEATRQQLEQMEDTFGFSEKEIRKLNQQLLADQAKVLDAQLKLIDFNLTERFKKQKVYNENLQEQLRIVAESTKVTNERTTLEINNLLQETNLANQDLIRRRIELARENGAETLELETSLFRKQVEFQKLLTQEIETETKKRTLAVALLTKELSLAQEAYKVDEKTLSNINKALIQNVKLSKDKAKTTIGELKNQQLINKTITDLNTLQNEIKIAGIELDRAELELQTEISQIEIDSERRSIEENIRQLERNVSLAANAEERNKALKILKETNRDGRERLEQLENEQRILESQTELQERILENRERELRIQNEIAAAQLGIDESKVQLQLLDAQVDQFTQLSQLGESLAANERTRTKERRESINLELDTMETRNRLELEAFDLKAKQILAERRLMDIQIMIAQQQAEQRKLEVEHERFKSQTRQEELKDDLAKIQRDRQASQDEITRLKNRRASLAELGLLTDEENKKLEAAIRDEEGKISQLSKQEEEQQKALDVSDRQVTMFDKQLDTQNKIIDAYKEQRDILQESIRSQETIDKQQRDQLEIQQNINRLRKEQELAKTTTSRKDDERIRKEIKAEQEKLKVSLEASEAAAASGITNREVQAGTKVVRNFDATTGQVTEKVIPINRNREDTFPTPIRTQPELPRAIPRAVLGSEEEAQQFLGIQPIQPTLAIPPTLGEEPETNAAGNVQSQNVFNLEVNISDNNFGNETENEEGQDPATRLATDFVAAVNSLSDELNFA